MNVCGADLEAKKIAAFYGAFRMLLWVRVIE
jgi:hypothetical protein